MLLKLFIQRAGCAAGAKTQSVSCHRSHALSTFPSALHQTRVPCTADTDASVWRHLLHNSYPTSLALGRFPCHVGPLAELCWIPEASHLQHTLITVWGHLFVTSGFREGSWPLHTFSSRVLECGLRAQVSPARQQLQPGS